MKLGTLMKEEVLSQDQVLALTKADVSGINSRNIEDVRAVIGDETADTIKAMVKEEEEKKIELKRDEETNHLYGMEVNFETKLNGARYFKGGIYVSNQEKVKDSAFYGYVKCKRPGKNGRTKTYTTQFTVLNNGMIMFPKYHIRSTELYSGMTDMISSIQGKFEEYIAEDQEKLNSAIA